MTVADLIEQLKALPQDAELWTYYESSPLTKGDVHHDRENGTVWL